MKNNKWSTNQIENTVQNNKENDWPDEIPIFKPHKIFQNYILQLGKPNMMKE